jgi:hypothetical protein
MYEKPTFEHRKLSMKLLALPFIFTTLISASAIAQELKTEEVQFSAKGQSPYTQICLASLISKKAERIKARELGISTNEKNRIQCNDQTLTEFAQSYSLITDYSNIATVE